MWDDVELLASDDTGSGQLGIHSRQEYGSALYQMHALIKVTSSEKVLSNPKLYACNSNDGCVLVADRTVVVLDNICRSLRMFAQFESEVDIVGLCYEGQFLVVGERSGHLHFIHVASKQTLLTQVLVQRSQNGRTYLNLILEEDSATRGIYHAFILTSNGFFCIMHLPLARTLEVTEKMDISAAKKLQEQVETCFVSTEDYHTVGCLTAVTRHMANKIFLMIGGVGDSVMSVWEVDPNKKLISIQNVADSSIIEAAQKLQVVDSLLFVLDNENILTLWDVHTLTLTWACLSVHIEEFLLTSESDFSTVAGWGSANLKLVALTKPDNNQQMRSIMVFLLPAMDQLFSLEVTSVSSLVQSGINTDTIYFLEGIDENNQKSSDMLVSLLVMRCLTEALPENRLSRLLHKHKFTEAENFAIQFGLDVELVYKVKVSSVLERLASESAGSDERTAWLELVSQAKETLDKIKDNQFVVEYCINTPWPTYETAQEMLNYAKNRVLKRDGTAVTMLSVGDPASLTEVLQAQMKLTSFYAAFGPQKFSGTAWFEFLNNDDIFKDILLQLKEGNLSSAQCLWLRHQADFENDFGVNRLDELLNAVPATVSFKELCPWFKEVVVPFVRRFVAQGQKRLAKWLEEGARNLELTDKMNWPENGLEMAQVFFTSRNPDEIGLASSWNWVPLKNDDHEEVHHLAKLVSALRGLVDLYRKYNCKLALCNFEKENANTIVFRMLDKVLAAELIPAALEKFIEPYMYHHNLQKDDLLLQYLKGLEERYCTRSTSVFDTTWEAKAIAVLGCMTSLDLIFEGVLAIMQGAVVPWSPGVEQLVRRYLDMDHAKVKLLQEGYTLMEMKKLLRSYGIKDTNLLKDKQVMLMLVKYILKQDTPSSLEDALKMANAYMLPPAGVYLQKIINLLDKGKGESIISLLKSLPPAEAVEIVKRTLIWGRLELEDEMEYSKEEVAPRKIQLHLKHTLVEMLKFLLDIQKDNPLKKEEYEADLKQFKTIAALQENFNVCISVEGYENPSLRSQLLEDSIEACRRSRKSHTKQEENATSEESGTKKPWTESRVYRQASLLRWTEQEVGSELVLRALEAGRVEEALKRCREACEHRPNEQTGQMLFLASQKLCHMLGSDTLMVTPEGINLPAVIYELACQAATLCSADILLDALELCKYTSFAHEISGKCQIEDYGFISETTSSGADKDPYVEWTFDDFFTEDGAVLDPPAVLPVAYQITSCMVPLAERRMYPLDSTSLPHCPFIQGRNLCLPCRTPICSLLSSFQECSQFELALGLITSSHWSLVRHMIGNNMDIGLGEQLHDQPTRDEARKFLFAMMQSSASLIKTVVPALLHKVFNSHRIDHSIALGYCILLPKETVYGKLWDIINNTLQNYSKVLAVSLLGAQLASHYKEEEKKQAFEELITDAEWGIQLGEFGIDFHNLFRKPSIRKKELLRTLVQHLHTDLILKYCSTFLLDSDAALQLCIETSLLRNAGTSPVEEGSSGDTGKHPPASIVTRAAEVIPLLRSTTGLVASLSAMLHKLDPYDYETIESLLFTMEKAGGGAAGIPLNRALMLIKHLKSYKRNSVPGVLEHQHAFEQSIPLSPAAQTRLPFHLIFFKTTQYFWKIIAAELNEESFPKLLLISKFMKVSLDTLHVSAAKQVFQEKLKPQVLELARKGYLPAVDKETTQTIQTIQSYLLSITNPEWAAALAYTIAQELPTGPAKVQALKFCVGLVEKWLKNTAVTELHEKVRVHLKKVKVQHQRTATEAVLAAHKLDSEKHQKLLGKPANLVVLLYQHSSIAERVENPTGRDYPDIHAAAKEIAEINDLDMKKILDMLLEKWLCPDVLPANKPSEVSENLQDDEDLKRVIYLLQLRPLDNGLRILYECAVSTTSPIGVNQLTFAHRSRALRCLIYMADSSAVEALFKKPIEHVKYFLKCLIYLAELETLNIPYTYESFHSTPKEGMIKGLWKNHSHEPRAVKLVTELSLQYKVHDPVLWNGLLQKLISFKMIHYVRKVLVEITGIHALWQIPKFSQAWQSVILDPLLAASCPPSPSQLEACHESFKTLLECPVLSDLDIMGIAKQYAQLDLLALASGCLLLIPQPEKRAQQIQGFLTMYRLETILQQVEKHMTQGELAGLASQIRHLILDHVVSVKDGGFAAAEFFPLMNVQAMGPDKLKGLVKNLVDQQRMDDAAALITEYLNNSGNPVPTNMSSSDTVKMYFSERA
ncbi:kinetochore-associated protein 1 isoform X2 [Hemicordylus capensis]|uniref:kinetochore-associated protein 1 isoform X2 n=1 Tax=Hemicordylus capensis TaxID=884348 RepID=UPI0023049701|nr:kinetochore-associated protein 1 isoform X2 [Hemicordylus capensis]